jgi:hypothetical protein
MLATVPAERVPLEAHLGALSPDERALWERFAGLIRDAGPSEMIVTKSRIAFRAHRIFAGGFFMRGRLEIFFDLPEPVPERDRDHRFRQVWEQARRLWTHRLSLQSLDDVDEQLGAWLKTSWTVYSRPPAER